MKKNISVEELKMLQLKILDSIDDFCKKNEMHFYIKSPETPKRSLRTNGYDSLLRLTSSVSPSGYSIYPMTPD